MTSTDDAGNKANDYLSRLERHVAGSTVFAALWQALFTQAERAARFKANKKQDAAQLGDAVETVRAQLLAASDKKQAQHIYLTNRHALHCGAALLEPIRH